MSHENILRETTTENGTPLESQTVGNDHIEWDRGLSGTVIYGRDQNGKEYRRDLTDEQKND